MSIIKFNPEHNILADFANMQRKFNDFFADFGLSTGFDPVNSDMWSPSVDITDRKSDYIVKVELPGIRKEDVKITVFENILTIKGEKRSEYEHNDEGFRRMERRFGHFMRTFTLPTGIKSDGIIAEFKDGMLTITLPKDEVHRRNEIPIR